MFTEPLGYTITYIMTVGNLCTKRDGKLTMTIKSKRKKNDDATKHYVIGLHVEREWFAWSYKGVAHTYDAQDKTNIIDVITV